MAFLAKMKIGEETYNVLSADYEISSSVDERLNMPSARPRIGLINVIIESSAKVEFFEWASRGGTKSGKLVFYKKDNEATMKSLDFIDGYCVYFKELFDFDGAVPMRTMLKIAARQIECMGIVRAEKWPGYKEGKPAPDGTGHEEISSFNPSQMGDY